MHKGSQCSPLLDLLLVPCSQPEVFTVYSSGAYEKEMKVTENAPILKHCLFGKGRMVTAQLSRDRYGRLPAHYAPPPFRPLTKEITMYIQDMQYSYNNRKWSYKKTLAYTVMYLLRGRDNAFPVDFLHLGATRPFLGTVSKVFLWFPPDM